MYGIEMMRIWIGENAEILFRMIFAGYLLVLTVMDIRSRKLHLGMLLSGFPLAVAGRIVTGNIPAALVIAGGVSGGLFVIVSRVTEEAFGYGDSILITITGIFLGIWDLLSLLGSSKFISPEKNENLRRTSKKLDLDPDRQCRETDPSDLMEGLYIKVEADGQVVDRLKYVRATFTQTVEVSQTHWLDRPIVPNGIAIPVESLFAPMLPGR